MFTIDQIKAAHAQVKSGADFPAYIRDLIQLGVKNYETYVADGHTVYHGENGYTAGSAARYTTMPVSETVDKNQFLQSLKEHQEGKSDFPAFCKICAGTGVEKWIVDTDKMTCTYYDRAGNVMLAEHIPGA